MGTVVARKRKDGTIAYMARIVMERDGKTHREAQTFDRRAAALTWMRQREGELAQPGAFYRPDDPPLAAVIDRYIAESKRAIGRTKEQVLRAIKRDPIAELKCSQVDSAAVVAFAQRLTCQPQTVGNYLSHLGAVVTLARPAWGYPLEQRVVKDAWLVGKSLGITSKSIARERRPTLLELDRLMRHFGEVRARRIDSVPMQAIVAFALYSTRRLEEITRIAWDDLEPGRILVRAMKHPGQKIGNDVWCDLPPEAEAIIRAQPRHSECIFPYSTDAIGAAFTRAGQLLGIEDLHLHDLRHHGISRLFELGWTIPHVAAVSGHRSWQSLKRYTHLRQRGDCMEGWKWLPAVSYAASSMSCESM